MEVNFVEHETFLLYLTIFILFCFSCMLIIIATQLNDYNRRIEKERDSLLKLLGRQKPEEYAVTDKNTLVLNLLQERMNQLKMTSSKINQELEKHKRLFVPEFSRERHRKIFIEKVLDVE